MYKAGTITNSQLLLHDIVLENYIQRWTISIYTMLFM